MSLFSVSDSDLKKRMIEAGKIIQEKYCYKMSNRPTMLPPIPNSRFIDKFPEEGCSEDNKKDKIKQESYAAEVKVYRALESLKEDIVVLHSLEYTNRQFRSFVKDHKFDEDKPNKMFGECDIVAISKDHIVIMEVSNAKIDKTKTTNKGIKNVFKKKKKQAERTKKLITNIIKEFSGKVSAIVKWYCAFLSVSTEEEAELELFEEEQKLNIIFSDSFDTSDQDHKNFQVWWKGNVPDRVVNKNIDGKVTADLRHILIGLWNIDSQNKVNPEECSFGSNIMKVDFQLRNADITYGFRNSGRPGFHNPNFVQAHEVFKGMGILYLTKEQDNVFKSKEKFLWINGPAGSGKTLLILGKAIEAAKSGEYVVIFANGGRDRFMGIHHKAFIDSKIPFKQIKCSGTKATPWFNLDKRDELLAQEICLHLKESCRIILIDSIPRYILYSDQKIGSLEIMKRIILNTIAFGGKENRYKFFLDDEQSLLKDECYDNRKGKIKDIRDLVGENVNYSIWVFSDIAQSFNHTNPRSFSSLLSSMDSMKQTYSNHMYHDCTFNIKRAYADLNKAARRPFHSWANACYLLFRM